MSARTPIAAHVAERCSLCGSGQRMHRCWSGFRESFSQEKTLTPGAPSATHLRTIDEQDRREARDRARTVLYLLERCGQELERLERIEHLAAGEGDALHSAAVSVARALRDLGRFQ